MYVGRPVAARRHALAWAGVRLVYARGRGDSWQERRDKPVVRAWRMRQKLMPVQQVFWTVCCQGSGLLQWGTELDGALYKRRIRSSGEG